MRTNILKECSLEQIDFPSSVAEQDQLTEKLARVETREFTAIWTRKSDRTIYRLGLDKAKTNTNYYQTFWAPLIAAASSRFEDKFSQVEALALASSGEWNALIQKLDHEETARQRKALAQDDKVNPALREEAASKTYEVKSAALVANAEVQSLAAKILKPLLDALLTDRKSMLDTVVPPALLHFMLELDRQHHINWAPQSKSLLDHQILFFEMKLLEQTIETMSFQKPGVDMQVHIKSMRDSANNMRERWKAFQASLLAKKPGGHEQLQALSALTKLEVNHSQLAILQDQSRHYEREFGQLRREAMIAFLGVRGIGFLFSSRHDGTNRLFTVLHASFSSYLRESGLLNRLLNCSKEEGDSIRKAAEKDWPALQKAWDEVYDEQMPEGRMRRLLGQSTAKEKKAARAAAKKSPPADSDATTQAKNRKRLSQPIQRAPEDKIALRKKRIQDFLEKYGILELAKSPANEHEGLVLIELMQSVRQLANQEMKPGAMLKTSIDVLSKAMLEQSDEVASTALLSLLARLRAAQVEREDSKFIPTGSGQKPAKPDQ